MSNKNIQKDFDTQAQKIAVCESLYHKAKKKKKDKKKSNANTFSIADGKEIQANTDEVTWEEVEKEISQDGFINL